MPRPTPWPRPLAAVSLLVGAAALPLGACASGESDWSRLSRSSEALAQLPDRERLVAAPYVHGKLAVVWVKHREGEPPWYTIDTSRMRNPSPGQEGLYASSPEDVGTVARLDCMDEPAAQYDSAERETAVVMDREVCTLALADLSLSAVIHRDTFRGPAPPEVTTGEVGALGFRTLPVSIEEVEGSLARLPRR